MRLSELFPSQYLHPEDLQGREVPVTIKAVERVEMPDQKTKQVTVKPVIYFEKAKKGLVLNKTNAFRIAEILGSDDTAQWIGREIVLYATTTLVKGTETPCVRVKPLLAEGE